MKYDIKISGGFTGFVQEYKGEKKLSTSEREALIKAFKNLKKTEENKHLRDGFNYQIKLIFDDTTYYGEFTDATLPSQLRIFVQNVT